MARQEGIWQEGIDRRALFTCYIRKLPTLFLLSMAGAVAGSAIYLLVAFAALSAPVYVSSTEYYIDFADGQLEAKNYYNDFTWNDVIATGFILDNIMELLGDGFARGQVEEMITADILSDVRYLTITIQGAHPQQVGMVRDAFETAAASFGEFMEEFDAIYKIRDSGIAQKEIPLFAWRAALLGAVLLAGAGIFAIAFRFCMGSCIYTKAELANYFGLPVYGMIYAKNNEKSGRQETMLLSCLKKATEGLELVYVADAGRCGTAEKFLEALGGIAPFEGTVTFEVFDEARCQSGVPVILAIPFGAPCRERAADEIQYLRQMGCPLMGCVLAEADEKWTRLYFYEHGRKKKLVAGAPRGE